MSNNGYNTPLSEYQSAELMKELRAAYYLLSDSCNPETGAYSSSVNGWKNGNFEIIAVNLNIVSIWDTYVALNLFVFFLKQQ